MMLERLSTCRPLGAHIWTRDEQHAVEKHVLHFDDCV